MYPTLFTKGILGNEGFSYREHGIPNRMEASYGMEYFHHFALTGNSKGKEKNSDMSLRSLEGHTIKNINSQKDMK